MGLLYLGATLVTGLLFLPGLHLGRLAWATPGQLLVLLHLGMVASGLGFLLFNAGARRVSLGALAVFNNAKVPLALLAAALVFREKVDWVRLAAGGTLIALALLLDAGRPPRTEALPGGV
jgi:drug/metabolite transporter (DMT)-like permease